MPRLILHAGFSKTGSTSIQHALTGRRAALARLGVSVAGPGAPLGVAALSAAVEGALGQAGALTPRFEAALADCDGGVFVASAENLGRAAAAETLTGLDQRHEVEVVLYYRPAVSWIPSAWKQWGLKTGAPLSTKVAQAVARGASGHLAALDAFARALPQAKITVRPFVRQALEGGDAVVDFFTLIGAAGAQGHAPARHANASFDGGLLYAMLQNAPRLFDGPHDNRLFDRLEQTLPPACLATNMPMLSRTAAQQIATSHREEALAILTRYCGMTLKAARAFHRAHFLGAQPKGAPGAGEMSYMTLKKAQLTARAAGVLLAVFGENLPTPEAQGAFLATLRDAPARKRSA